MIKDSISMQIKEISAFGISGLNERLGVVETEFNNNKWGSSAKAAVNLIASTLSYTYFVLTGKEFDRKTTLHQRANKVLRLYKNQLTQPDLSKTIVKNLIDAINALSVTVSDMATIGDLTSVSNSNRKSSVKISLAEAQFIVSSALSICLFLLEMLFRTTSSISKNSVGSDFSIEHLIKLQIDSEYNIFTDQIGTEYTVNIQTNLIRQITKKVPQEVTNEEKLINYMKEFMQQDAVLEKQFSGVYIFYSNQMDYHYAAVVNNHRLTVSQI